MILHYDIGNSFNVTYAKFEYSKFRKGKEISFEGARSCNLLGT
jgi:hypothetical protein